MSRVEGLGVRHVAAKPSISMPKFESLRSCQCFVFVLAQ